MMVPMSEDPRLLYRKMIDALVVACASGPGQVSAERVRVGVWNANAEEVADAPAEQHAMNALLASLDGEQRETLAVLFAQEFASGVFSTLEVLYAARVTPFDAGYEGTPADDFLDRMDGSDWPTTPA